MDSTFGGRQQHRLPRRCWGHAQPDSLHTRPHTHARAHTHTHMHTHTHTLTHSLTHSLPHSLTHILTPPGHELLHVNRGRGRRQGVGKAGPGRAAAAGQVPAVHHHADARQPAVQGQASACVQGKGYIECIPLYMYIYLGAGSFTFTQALRGWTPWPPPALPQARRRALEDTRCECYGTSDLSIYAPTFRRCSDTDPDTKLGRFKFTRLGSPWEVQRHMHLW